MVESSPPTWVENLVELLRWRAEVTPTQSGFRYLDGGEGEGRAMSYAELDRRARAIGAGLREHAEPGERVILLYPPGLEYVEAFFGCLYAGVIAVPAYPPNPRRLERTVPRLVSIVEDSGAELALSTGAIAAMARSLTSYGEALNNMGWLATDEIGDEMADGWSLAGVDERTVAFLQYTSGSTGRPKGVVLDHRTLMRNEALIQKAFGSSEQTVAVNWLPLYHDMGLIGAVLQPVYCGCTSVLMSPLDFLKRPARWLEAISRFEGTDSTAPNFAYDLAVRKTPEEIRDNLDLSSWKRACNGAEPIRMGTLERFADYFEPCGFDRRAFMPAYGLAEVGLIVSATPRDKEPRVVEADGRDQVSCGLPLGDFEVRVVKPGTRRVVDDGEVGEIWLRGGSVAPGYWEKNKVNEEVFRAHTADGEGPFLRTGDVGAVVDGEVVITGRLKDLMIIRGVNHYPHDIEATVETVDPAIRRGCGAAFTVDSNGDDEESLVVVTEVKPDLVDDANRLAGRIRETIATAHRVVPAEVVLIEPRTIEKTSSGKLQRFAVRNSYQRGELAEIARQSSDDLQAQQKQDESTRSAIESWLAARVAEERDMEPANVDLEATFATYGIDSAEAVGIVGELERWLEEEIPATALYDFPTISALAAHLSGEGEQKRQTGTAPVISGGGDGGDDGLLAVVGAACRFPGAPDLESFWKLLNSGEEAIDIVPEWRWKPGTFTDPEQAGLDTMVTDRGGFVEGIDEFDPRFFGISPGEARAMDPQQRLMMETGWRALEDAGWSAGELAGSRTGVFVGQSGSDFARLYQGRPVRAGSGMAPSITANRLSYWLDLHGPSTVVDTACSSSLVALDQAIMNLRSGRCDAAIVGGVNVILSPDMSVAFSQARMLSPSGQCRSFDAAADGYVRGEGCGVIAVKRLRDAIRDGDRVRAVIRGAAINQDGTTNGLTAPSGAAQRAVIEEALFDAGVSAHTIGTVEAHGTGTELGDAIEAQALEKVFQEHGHESGACWLGSVKAQIGHLEAAAGMAGVIKAALMVERGVVVGQVNFETANPACEFEESTFEIPLENKEWPGRSDGEDVPRRVGVSSFGFGGTNAHVVVEEPPRMESVQREHASFERRRLWPSDEDMRTIEPGE